MLWTLLRKQLTEVFRTVFYDEKKNRMRSKGAIIAWILFFVIFVGGLIAGMFAALAMSLCGPLSDLGVGWMYFLLMSVMILLVGVLFSVFTTYSGLYLAKDNELLISLPIPVRTILGARVLNVYLMGTIYVLPAMIPVLAVYWVSQGGGALQVICGLILLLIITVTVLILSCLLGWVVAKISLKLKNKSFVTVLISLAFIVAYYYFFYFRAVNLMNDLLTNAVMYGAKIQGAAYWLYLFGRIGEGDIASAGIFLGAAALLSALMWTVLSRSFIGIATSGAAADRVRYVERTAALRSPFRALLAKELGRFTSSSAYMLNCGLGVVMITAAGVALLVKGRDIYPIMEMVFMDRPGAVPVLICSMLCTLSSMNDMDVPSVSLEGKSIWIPRSLPLSSVTVLLSKLALHLILTGIPMLIASVCAVSVMPGSLPLKLLVCVTALSYTLFTALFGMFLGLKMPVLTWTSEIAPIKQSGAVIIYIFAGWFMSLIPLGGYLLAGYRIGAAACLALLTLLWLALSFILYGWLTAKGSRIFSEL